MLWDYNANKKIILDHKSKYDNLLKIKRDKLLEVW